DRHCRPVGDCWLETENCPAKHEDPYYPPCTFQQRAETECKKHRRPIGRGKKQRLDSSTKPLFLKRCPCSPEHAVVKEINDGSEYDDPREIGNTIFRVEDFVYLRA